MTSRKTLTELEGVALSLIRAEGAMSAYDVKERLRGSPSAFWSGSAGAVYPLTRRLAERGFLLGEMLKNGKRPLKRYTLTEAGEAAVYDWLTDIKAAADPGYDPLRTRLLFFASLPVPARGSLFEALQAAIRATPPPEPAPPHVVALHEVWKKHRLAWLAEVRPLVMNG